MKWIVLVIITQCGVTTQDFFGETACVRVLHELDQRDFQGQAFCTPRRIK